MWIHIHVYTYMSGAQMQPLSAPACIHKNMNTHDSDITNTSVFHF